MKGLSGKRKLSFLGRGSNVAFVEIFIKPIYIEIGGEIFHFYFTLAFSHILMVFGEQPG